MPSAERLLEINGELINACLDGNYQRTKELCKAYPDCINIVGGAGYPPLHYSLFTQNYDLAAYMVCICVSMYTIIYLPSCCIKSHYLPLVPHSFVSR